MTTQELNALQLRGAALQALCANQTFLDAAEGIKMLIEWHGAEDALQSTSFDIEVQRAVRAGNHVAALHFLRRERGVWSTEDGALCDGDIIRNLLYIAFDRQYGDKEFFIARRAALAESIFAFE